MRNEWWQTKSQKTTGRGRMATRRDSRQDEDIQVKKRERKGVYGKELMNKNPERII